MKPVRKKTRSGARSPGSSADSPSHSHASPDGFAPEIFLDMAGAGASPAAPWASSPSVAAQMIDGFGMRPGPGPGLGPPFADGAGLITHGPEQLGMSPAEILAMFNDGGVDVGAFFPQHPVAPAPAPAPNGRRRSDSYMGGPLGMSNAMSL
jgi:hypothetical protein